MENLEKKIENIKDIFRSVMNQEGDTDAESKLICAYSYFISNTNKDYKYNQTYLVSYFEEFQQIRKEIIKKQKFVEKMKKELQKYLPRDMKRGILEVDGFWRIIWENEECKETLTDKIDKEKLMAKEYVISIIIERDNRKNQRISISQRLREEDKVLEVLTNLKSLL